MPTPTRLYDLTQPIYHGCPAWPGQELPEVRWECQHVNHGCNSERVTFNTHTGTHIDVPYHFLPDGKTLDDVPVDAFAGPVVFLDVSPASAPGAILTADVLRPVLRASNMAAGDIVVLHTGYGPKRGFNPDYLHNFPYLDKSGAELLADAGAKGVGTDAFALGGYGGIDKAAPCHIALLSRDIFIIEELLIPAELLDGAKRWLSAFPIWLRGCSGAPARAVVWEFAE